MLGFFVPNHHIIWHIIWEGSLRGLDGVAAALGCNRVVAWRIFDTKHIQIEFPHDVFRCNLEQSGPGEVGILVVGVVIVKEPHQRYQETFVLALFVSVYYSRHGRSVWIGNKVWVDSFEIWRLDFYVIHGNALNLCKSETCLKFSLVVRVRVLWHESSCIFEFFI